MFLKYIDLYEAINNSMTDTIFFEQYPEFPEGYRYELSDENIKVLMEMCISKGLYTVYNEIVTYFLQTPSKPKTEEEKTIIKLLLLKELYMGILVKKGYPEVFEESKDIFTEQIMKDALTVYKVDVKREFKDIYKYYRELLKTKDLEELSNKIDDVMSEYEELFIQKQLNEGD